MQRSCLQAPDDGSTVEAKRPCVRGYRFVYERTLGHTHDMEQQDRLSTGTGSDGFVVNIDGHEVTVQDDGRTLLDVLRGQLGATSPKDGCSPQGQCGCCTVLVDGQPRVSCVTPVRRVAGRRVTTLDGLEAGERSRWAYAFARTGGSQCGFCTPGIIMRFSGLRSAGTTDTDRVTRSLSAHLCRCTGWQTVIEAWGAFDDGDTPCLTDRAAERATIEGRSVQAVGSEIVLGQGGFAADMAPDGALVAVRDRSGRWVVAETLYEARRAVGKVQGRRTTVDSAPPVGAPPGPWDAVLRTTWVEPAYLETDSAWCEPGGEPSSPLANGGAFGGKTASPVAKVARELADEHGRTVLALMSREDTVHLGPKRRPVAGGAMADGTGVMRVVRTPGIVEAIRAVAPDLTVEEVDVAGPPTSAAIRAAGWAEAVVLLAGARGSVGSVVSPDGSVAEAEVANGRINVTVRCGDPLDATVLRSYCIGAAHMAWSWVTSESLSVDDSGLVSDLTVGSFGIVRAGDTPQIDVTIEQDDDEWPRNGSDAVFAAAAAATWIHRGTPTDWPTGP